MTTRHLTREAAKARARKLNRKARERGTKRLFVVEHVGAFNGLGWYVVREAKGSGGAG